MIEKYYTVHAYDYNTRLDCYGDDVEYHWSDWSGEQERTFPTREEAEAFGQQELPGFGIGFNLQVHEHELESIFRVSQTFSTLGDPNELDFNTEQEVNDAARELRESLSQMIQTWPIEENVEPSGECDENLAWEEAFDLTGAAFDDEGDRVSGPDKWTKEAADYIAEQAVKIEQIY